MESKESQVNELEQLKIISENQKILWKKLEELEKNDTEEVEKLKYIQSNINSLFEKISLSLSNSNSNNKEDISTTLKTNTTTSATDKVKLTDNDNTNNKIPISIITDSGSKANDRNTQPSENNTLLSLDIAKHLSCYNNSNNNSNTINDILESKEFKILYTSDEFENFIGKIIESPSSSYRQDLIKGEVKKGYMFTIQQIGELLNLIPYFSEKKSALQIIKNSVHDYYNKQDLLEYLNEETEEEKQVLFNLLF